jgi:RNA recognition motif-containing protein
MYDLYIYFIIIISTSFVCRADCAIAAVASKADADARSVFVGNVHSSFILSLFELIVIATRQVDFASTPEELQQHFQSCGAILRITILCDKFTGKPKG